MQPAVVHDCLSLIEIDVRMLPQLLQGQQVDIQLLGVGIPDDEILLGL